jgi:hypothetical protein
MFSWMKVVRFCHLHIGPQDYARKVRHCFWGLRPPLRSMPVGGIQELGLAMLLHHLRNHDQLVVNALALLPFLQALGREVEQVLPLHIVNVRSSRKRI